MKRLTLNLGEADGYAATEYDLIRRGLRKEKLLKKSLLYTVIDGSRIDEFISKGTYRPQSDKIFAFQSDELFEKEDSIEDFDVRDMLSEYECPAIAVFNASHFNPSGMFFKYVFKDTSKKQEALEAIINVKWN